MTTTETAPETTTEPIPFVTSEAPGCATALFQLTFLGSAMTLVLTSLPAIEPDQLGAVGLIEELPRDYWIGIGVLWIGFAVSLVGKRTREWVLACYAVGLVISLTAVPALVHEHARFPTAWMHVGFADYIAETGQVQPGFDARFNWPGGFVYIAFLSEAVGIDSSRALLRWAPTVINLALIAPLYSIAGAVSENVRARWLAVWFTLASLWVGQDYLAPQAFAFVVYLTIVAAILRMGHASGEGRGLDLIGRLQRRRPGLVRSDALVGRVPSPTLQRTPTLAVMLLLIGSAVVISHQLTPFLLTGALVVLLLTGHRIRASFVLLLAALTVLWVYFGASEFLEGHLDDLLGEVGGVGSAVGGGVTERFAPDPDRQIVLTTRVALAAAVATFGAAGFVAAWVRRRADWALAGLAVFPVGILLVNSYGGEGVLRVALFTTPFLVILAVGSFTPTAVRRRWLWIGTIALLGAVLAPAYQIARYGNEAFEVTRTEDLDLWAATARIANEGDIVMVPNFAGPWRHTRLIELEYRVLADEVGGPIDADAVESVLLGREGYLLLGVSGQRYEQYVNGQPPDWAERLEAELVDRPGWAVAYRRGDATLLYHSAVRAEAEKLAAAAAKEERAAEEEEGATAEEGIVGDEGATAEEGTVEEGTVVEAGIVEEEEAAEEQPRAVGAPLILRLPPRDEATPAPEEVLPQGPGDVGADDG